jgi:carbamoyl-phosphate synthase large subunit
MEHIEEAGIHSGDSACVLPPSRSAAPTSTMRSSTEALARALGVRGLINVQYAVKDGGVRARGQPARASRTACRS